MFTYLDAYTYLNLIWKDIAENFRAILLPKTRVSQDIGYNPIMMGSEGNPLALHLNKQEGLYFAFPAGNNPGSQTIAYYIYTGTSHIHKLIYTQYKKYRPYRQFKGGYRTQ